MANRAVREVSHLPISPVGERVSRPTDRHQAARSATGRDTFGRCDGIRRLSQPGRPGSAARASHPVVDEDGLATWVGAAIAVLFLALLFVIAAVTGTGCAEKFCTQDPAAPTSIEVTP